MSYAGGNTIIGIGSQHSQACVEGQKCAVRPLALGPIVASEQQTSFSLQLSGLVHAFNAAFMWLVCV